MCVADGEGGFKERQPCGLLNSESSPHSRERKERKESVGLSLPLSLSLSLSEI